MAERPLIGSLERIEAALDRIEAQAASLAAPVPDAPADAALQQRHRQLQVSVATALARIDALLADDDAPGESAPSEDAPSQDAPSQDGPTP